MLVNYRKRLGLTLVELVVVVVVLVAVAGLVIPRLTSVTEESKRQATLVTMGRLRDVLMGTPGMPGYFQDMELPPTAAGSLPCRIKPQRAGCLLGRLILEPGSNRPQLPSLLALHQQFRPHHQIGLCGPYLTNSAGTLSSALAQYSRGRIWPSPPSDSPPAVLDGWGNPIIIQWPQGNDITSALFGGLCPACVRRANGIFNTPLTVTDLTSTWQTAPSTGYDDVVLFLRQPLSFAPPIQSQ